MRLKYRMRFRFSLRYLLGLALPLTLALTLAVGMGGARAGAASEARLDQLFGALARAAPDEWQAIEQEIRAIWAQSGSPSLDLLMSRGAQALAEGDPQAAIEHFTALIDHAPDFAAAWNGRATAYYQAGLYGPALADIARVLTLEPRHFGALTGLAIILEDSGRTEQALAAYRMVLELNPNRTNVLEAIAKLERARGQVDI